MKGCDPARLPFLGFYEELALSLLLERLATADDGSLLPGFGAGDLLEAVAGDIEWSTGPVRSEVGLSPEPSGSAVPPASPCWGEDAALIESWFDAGEVLAQEAQAAQADAGSKPRASDRLERAWQWVRSFAVAKGLIAT